DPEGLEGRERVRVDGLDHEPAAGLERVMRSGEEPVQLVGGKVLDDVDRSDRTEALSGLALERLDRVAQLNLHAASLRALDHARTEAAPRRAVPRLAEEQQQLAPATAEVEHGRVSLEQRHVRRQ